MLGGWAPISGWCASVAPPVLMLGIWSPILGRHASPRAWGLDAYFRSVCLHGSASPRARGLATIFVSLLRWKQYIRFLIIGPITLIASMLRGYSIWSASCDALHVLPFEL